MFKKQILLLILAAVSLGARAQSGPQQPVAADPLQIAAAHDFGTTRFGRPVHHTFQFTNTGKEPLRLEQVSASCGCTTPQWSKEPVLAGATSSILVGYNAAAEGPFEKTVTVYYNGGKTKTIVIKGAVDKPIASAPVNAQVQLLKQTN